MDATGSVLKSILRFILYTGAIVCCLAGWCAAYILVTGFIASDLDRSYGLVLLLTYICMAFTPAVMFLTGLRTKTWQWVSIATVEAIVLAPAFCGLFVLIELAEGKIAV